MIWTLTNGETIFEISNGSDRTLRVADRSRLALQQETQVVTRARAEWPAAFPERASSALSFSIPVTFPPCASLEAALLEAHMIPQQCPRGGVLTCQYGETLITYSQAWRTGITAEPRGVTNLFNFAFQAVNPAFAELSPLAQMDSRYIANLSAITGLTGGGATKLDGLVTADVSVGFCAFLPALVIGSVATPKMMHLVAGTDTENADPAAGVIIIRPDDYDGSTNAKVWREKL